MSARTERRGIGLTMAAFEPLGLAFREQPVSDFGIDAHVELIEAEQPTGQLLGIQLKSGASYLSESYEDGYIFRIDREHVKYWLKHALPVLICLCDVDSEVIYWQAVTNETAISTGAAFKFKVPARHRVDGASRAALRDLLTPIVPADRYTIFETDDTSHNAAKRYSFGVVLNGNASKAEVAAIVRQLTNDGAKRRYHRNHLVAGRWGDSDAHVVWTFIYPSAEDFTRRNHICRSIWIREDLEDRFRPMGFDGENVGDNIVVDWSSSYRSRADFVSSNTLSKEDYLSETLPLIDELKGILEVLKRQLASLSRKHVAEVDFLASASSDLARANKIYPQISVLSFEPFECREMDAKLQAFASHLDNIWLYFSEKGLKTWDDQGRLDQSMQQMTYAREALQHLEYEIAKIH